MRATPSIRCLLLLITSTVIVVLSQSGCASDSPYGGQDISLSQAIAISKTKNVDNLLLEPDKGRMTIAIVINEAMEEIIDIDGKPIRIREGMELRADIGNLDAAELQELGFILPDIYSISTSTGINWNWLIYPVPILIFLFIVIWLYRVLRNQGKSRPPASDYTHSGAQLFSSETPAVTFNDVAGVDEAKQDLEEVVEFLKNPARFHALGARMPRGLLLLGSPGTGKTLLARALAGEAGVPFYSITGSEFVEMYVGVGASRVRDLFDQAKKSCPAIIFIDEIDAIGRHRGASLTSNREEEQTLNQILAEMDGFDPNTCLILLAATNRPDVLDPALLRPGRFDRQVLLELPDRKGRKAILEVHAKGKPLAKSVDFDALATETHGLSGAELANLINEAAILAARSNKKTIEMEDLDESMDRVLAGPEKKSREVSRKDKEISAYHEAGHALVAHNISKATPVHRVSIVARGKTGGFTRFIPSEERYLMTRSQLEDSLAALLGGHSAEELIFQEVSTGSSEDIRQATSLARKMITEYAMGETLSPRTFGNIRESRFLSGDVEEQRDYSEAIAKQIDDELNKLMDKAHRRASDVLQKYKRRLIYLAEKLIAEETLEGEELQIALAGRIPKSSGATRKKKT